ncbi:MAG TPA: hypothetical protein VNJ12_13405 [Candidatus Dormibacteraeota bacterium]|nr:hypothetical protein [Candidatus Dormibacteraeota bacterium]
MTPKNGTPPRAPGGFRAFPSAVAPGKPSPGPAAPLIAQPGPGVQGYVIQRLPVQNAMPPQGEDFEVHGYVALPAIGSWAIVCQRTVPTGRNGYIKRIANVFVGGGFEEGQGGVIWQIMIDLVDPTFGAGNQNQVAPFFDNIVASLGAVWQPSPIDGIRVREQQTFALVVKNVNVIVAGQFIGGRLGGYFHPIDLEPPNMGF